MPGSNQRWWWWCLTGVLITGCVPESDDVDPVTSTGELTAMVCGFEVHPSPQTIPEGACETGRTVIGPVRFERERGRPAVETVDFETAVDGDVCVTIRNGDDDGNDTDKGNKHDERVSAGWISVDGDDVAAPEDFNQNVELVERESDLGAGQHELRVRLASKPGSSVEIEVREPRPTLDQPSSKIGPAGALEITNVATDHPLLTPNGDGHHDETSFNVDGIPLIDLPGKEDGSVAYYLEWEVFIYDLESCALESTNISGSTRVNSPTNVSTVWDGTNSSGDVLDSGNYAYFVEVSLVREDGFVYDTVVSDRFGMTLDDGPADYDERPALQSCDTTTDPFACRCPGGGGIGGGDPNCSFGDAHPAHASIVSLDDPGAVDTSFITTTVDPETGRHRVVADLREFNAGGLVLQGSGTWSSEAELRQWVEDLTGVPSDGGDSLFNFDYVQIGTSTGVTVEGLANQSFNHLLLDAITDQDGQIAVDGVVTDVGALLNDGSAAPAAYQVNAARADDECTTSSNTNGENIVRAKFCAYNEALPLSSGDLGVYHLRTSIFDVTADGEATTLDEACIVNGIFSCGYRTVAVPVDSIEIESTFYVEDGNGTRFAGNDTIQIADATAASLSTDRRLSGGDVADGVCTRGVVMNDGLRVRMDSADGAVPGTCIVNGIFF